MASNPKVAQQQHLPAKQKTQLPSKGIDYERDAGAGMEGADKDSYAIPFLVILQPLSPQITEGTVVGAKPGALLNTVTNDLYERAFIIPCAFQRRWVRWGARDAGGGFKGEFTAAQVAEMRSKGEVKEVDNHLFFPLSDGSINEKKSDRLSDTRSHFVLVLREADDDVAVPMVFALTSTGIKHSKNFMSRIDGIKFKRQDGTPYTPPSFSHIYAVGTAKQTNEKGTWWTPEIVTHGAVASAEMYELAKAFHDSVTAGKVQAAHDSVKEDSGGTQRGF